MARYIIGDLRTGRRLVNLPVLTGPWSDDLDQDETIKVKVDMLDPDVQALNLRSAATAAKSFLGVVENGQIMACGPIWTHNYDRDSFTLELGAAGIGSIFNHRRIIPLLAATTDVTQWTIPDPADTTNSGKTIPNPALTTTYTGIWWGTMAKRLVQQALAWTGGNLPIVFQPDEIDGIADHTKTWYGADFKALREALSDLTNLDGGPEFNFQAGFTTDRLGVQWTLQAGTVTQPLLFGATRPRWNLGVAESPMFGLSVGVDASKMGSLSWATAGRQADDVLVSRAYSSALIDQGYPLMEVTDSSHTTVSQQSTLDKYARQNLTAAQSATETWSFKVKAYPKDADGNAAGPQVGSYSVGDYCEVARVKFKPATADRQMVGDPYLQDGGTSVHRIVGLAGDEKSEDITVTCAPGPA